MDSMALKPLPEFPANLKYVHDVRDPDNVTDDRVDGRADQPSGVSPEAVNVLGRYGFSRYHDISFRFTVIKIIQQDGLAFLQCFHCVFYHSMITSISSPSLRPSVFLKFTGEIISIKFIG